LDFFLASSTLDASTLSSELDPRPLPTTLLGAYPCSIFDQSMANPEVKMLVRSYSNTTVSKAKELEKITLQLDTT
jgi:hypothetical protein